jgi:hypothetical protein
VNLKSSLLIVFGKKKKTFAPGSWSSEINFPPIKVDASDQAQNIRSKNTTCYSFQPFILSN